jgi:hypothetical protein
MTLFQAHLLIVHSTFCYMKTVSTLVVEFPAYEKVISVKAAYTYTL